MKRIGVLPLFLALCLLCCACAGAPANAPVSTAEQQGGATLPIPSGAEETLAPESVPPRETETAAPTETDAPAAADGESAAFTASFPECSDTVLAFVYNAPFTNGALTPTVVWNEGEYDQLYIVPRYVGSTVSAYALTANEEGYLSAENEPRFSSAASADGCIISASLERPEGFARWLLCVEDAEGHDAWLQLDYNGRYGTPRYEFLEDVYLSSLIETPSGMEDWNDQMEVYGYETFWAFWRAAARNGMDAWEAAERCFTQLTEFGDGAAWTMCESGDMDGDAYTFRCARLRAAYCGDDWDSIDALTKTQYETYQQIGNAWGILGTDDPDALPELYFSLTGLTVFNPSLAASKVQVTVNGIDVGTFALERGDFCTLLDVEMPEQVADRPLTVTVRVVETNYGAPDEAIIEVYPGLGGNISGAL